MEQEKPAVLLIIFNRPGHARKVLETIRRYRPDTLYIAADGPRPAVSSDAAACESARGIVAEIDWPCAVHTLFRKQNVGCKKAVSAAISWFFDEEKEGIILEDDCLPAEDFFGFSATMLSHYRDDARVMQIGGANLQMGHRRGAGSYYFSSIPSIWGWAGWRRVWKNYDINMTLFPEFEHFHLMQHVFPDARVAAWATAAARQAYENKLDTWDYQLAFSVIVNNGLCVTPNVNLVSNIGFQANSRMTTNPDDVHANIPLGSLHEIVHPRFFMADKAADTFQLSLSIPRAAGASARPFSGPLQTIKRLFHG